jgi:hypothetical protein
MLPDALGSVFGQTEQDFQLIVQYCQKNWMHKLIEACQVAKGEFIVPLCDDDLLAPTFLEACLRCSTNADMIYTDRRFFQHVERQWFKPWTWRGIQPEQGKRIRQLDGFRFNGPDGTPLELNEANAGPKGYYTTGFPVELFAWGSTLPMTCMIRRSWFEGLGGFAEVAHADTEFWLRSVVHKARFAYVPQPLFWYREHAGQYSRTYKESLDHAMAMYHARYFRIFGGLWTSKRLDDGRWEILFVAPEDREKVLEANPEFAKLVLPLVGEPVAMMTPETLPVGV